jgi:hypothetical protein
VTLLAGSQLLYGCGDNIACIDFFVAISYKRQMRVRLEKVNNCFKTCLDPDPQLKPDYRSYPDTNLQFQKISSAGLGKEHTHLSFAKYFSKWIPEYTQQAAASRARKQGSMEARRQEGKEARRQGGKEAREQQGAAAAASSSSSKEEEHLNQSSKE